MHVQNLYKPARLRKLVEAGRPALALAALLTLPGTPRAANFTVSKDGHGAFTTLRSANPSALRKPAIRHQDGADQNPFHILDPFFTHPKVEGPTVADAQFTKVPAGGIEYVTASDSVGPLIDSARVQERIQSSDDTLFVSFSEKVAGLEGASLLLIKREGGAPVPLTVLSARDLAQGGRFQVAVADLGPLAPREGDSLRINPSGPLVDAYGNHAHALNRPIPLGLKTVPKPPVLEVTWDRPYETGEPDPGLADFILYSVEADSTLIPVLAGDGRGALLSCPGASCGQPSLPDSGPGAPSFTLLTDRPVKLAVTLFTNLGGYVNSLSGEITPAHLGVDDKGLPIGTSLFHKDERGRYAIRLAWNLRSHDRGSAGTGAYLAKVSVSGLAEDGEGNTYGIAEARTFRFGVLSR